MLPIYNLNVIVNHEEERREELRFYNIERRVMRANSDPFQLNDEIFKKSFRLTKEMANYILDSILDTIRNENNVGISPNLKFFATLYFYAHGIYQKNIGDTHFIAMSQQTISKIIPQVTNAIIEKLGRQFIKFPVRAHEKVRIKQRFWEATQFPGAIGAIDFTHVKILAPHEEEHNYLNRKMFHSKNVQLVCDFDLKILNINARHAGSTHDALIWRLSAVKIQMERCYNLGERNTWLLGDAGYPLEPWLMTPIINAEPGTPQFFYTQAHMQARNCVERCIGVLKGRFRCISSDTKLRYSPVKVGHIINACAILHNICIDGRLENDFVIENDNERINANNVYNLHEEGVINMYF